MYLGAMCAVFLCVRLVKNGGESRLGVQRRSIDSTKLCYITTVHRVYSKASWSLLTLRDYVLPLP